MLISSLTQHNKVHSRDEMRVKNHFRWVKLFQVSWIFNSIISEVNFFFFLYRWCLLCCVSEKFIQFSMEHSKFTSRCFSLSLFFFHSSFSFFSLIDWDFETRHESMCFVNGGINLSQNTYFQKEEKKIIWISSRKILLAFEEKAKETMQKMKLFLFLFIVFNVDISSRSFCSIQSLNNIEVTTLKGCHKQVQVYVPFH